eukprot:EG_transcript_34061
MMKGRPSTSNVPPPKRRKKATHHPTPKNLSSPPPPKPTKEAKPPIVKRPANHAPSRPTDLYLTKSTPNRAYKERALKLLAVDTVREIELHSLGAQVGRCCELAMSIQKESPIPVRLWATTGSVTLTDDLPVADELAEDPGQQQRLTSAVHIRVLKQP